MNDFDAAATDPFTAHESAVRSYCRSFPALFHRAKNAEIFDADGRRWIDFLAGAGALNYGHNPEPLKRALIAYLESDGPVSSLDLHTTAKAEFLRTFVSRVLAPRGLDHRVQFTGPTGANAVEAAFKLARKVTKRTNIVAFTGGYHGHSLGALAATANHEHREGAGRPLDGVTFMPYPDNRIPGLDALAYFEAMLNDGHSGLDRPAAVIVETIQGEGGVYQAPVPFLQGLRRLCDTHGMLLIVDEIQVGCGRTGPFFSFEPAGIVPDMVTVSKSISGYGLPMALLLIRPQHDIWSPAEHTGTFRGHQLAFVAGAAALRWRDELNLSAKVAADGAWLSETLRAGVAARHPTFTIRGAGLIWGVDTAGVDASGAFAKAVSRQAFATGLIIERVGRNDTVLKLLPPLTIPREHLAEGVAILDAATAHVLAAGA